MPVDQKYSIILKNAISQIPVVVQRLLAEVQKVGSLSQRERCRMCLALEEAITNSLVHGNLAVDSNLKDSLDNLYERTIQERQQTSPYRERSVEIAVWIDTQKVIFEITDEGAGFDVSQVPDPTQENCLDRPSGRGVFLMKAYMDEVRFNSKGNQVTLMKSFSVRCESNVASDTVTNLNCERA